MEYCQKTIYICCQLVSSLSIVFAPIIPFTSEKIQNFFGLEPILGIANNGIPTANLFTRAVTITLPEGNPIIAPQILFNQVDDTVIATQVEKLGK